MALAVFGHGLASADNIGGCMTGIVAAFKALSLDAQTEAYPQSTAPFNAGRAPYPA
jgi:hypothetical protein